MKFIKALLLVVTFFLCFNICFASSENTVKKQEPFIKQNEVFVREGDTPRVREIERGALKQAVAPNSVVLFPIENAFRAEDLTGLRVFAGDWEMGQEFIGPPTIEYRMFFDTDGVTPLGYKYAAALPVLGLAGEQKAVVKGRISIDDHWAGSKKVNFAFTVRDDGENPFAESYVCFGKDFPIDFGSSAQQVILNFEGNATFEVNAQNQPFVNVGISNEPFTDYVFKYPKAKLNFLSFTQKPIFNRKGMLSVMAPENYYIYEITPIGLEAVDAIYDSEKKAFCFKTMRLGDYIISDRRLNLNQKMRRPSNPLTGTNCLYN